MHHRPSEWPPKSLQLKFSWSTFPVRLGNQTCAILCVRSATPLTSADARDALDLKSVVIPCEAIQTGQLVDHRPDIAFQTLSLRACFVPVFEVARLLFDRTLPLIALKRHQHTFDVGDVRGIEAAEYNQVGCRQPGAARICRSGWRRDRL